MHYQYHNKNIRGEFLCIFDHMSFDELIYLLYSKICKSWNDLLIMILKKTYDQEYINNALNTFNVVDYSFIHGDVSLIQHYMNKHERYSKLLYKKCHQITDINTFNYFINSYMKNNQIKKILINIIKDNKYSFFLELPKSFFSNSLVIEGYRISLEYGHSDFIEFYENDFSYVLECFSKSLEKKINLTNHNKHLLINIIDKYRDVGFSNLEINIKIDDYNIIEYAFLNLSIKDKILKSLIKNQKSCIAIQLIKKFNYYPLITIKHIESIESLLFFIEHKFDIKCKSCGDDIILWKELLNRSLINYSLFEYAISKNKTKLFKYLIDNVVSISLNYDSKFSKLLAKHSRLDLYWYTLDHYPNIMNKVEFRYDFIYETMYLFMDNQLKSLVKELSFRGIMIYNENIKADFIHKKILSPILLFK